MALQKSNINGMLFGIRGTQNHTISSLITRNEQNFENLTGKSIAITNTNVINARGGFRRECGEARSPNFCNHLFFFAFTFKNYKFCY